MTRIIKGPRWPQLAALASLIGATPLSAQMPVTTDRDFGTGRDTGSMVELSTELTRSDNIRRTSGPRVDDTMLMLGVTVDTARNGSRVDYVLTGDLDWYEFLDDTYDNRLLGYLDGGLTVDLVQERFVWGFRESFSQAVVDPLAAPTPDNLENINYFTTGPRLYLHLGRRLNLELHADYSATESDLPSSAFESGIDSERYAAGFVLSRPLSPSSELSASLDFQRVEFDESDAFVFGDYDRYEALIGYSRQIGRTALSLALGSTRVDDGTDRWNNFLARAELSRRISPSSSLVLRASQQTADAADIIRGTFDPARASTMGLRIASRDPFRERALGADWRFARARTSLAVGVTLTEEDHEAVPALDRSMYDIYVEIGRRLRPTVNFLVSGRYEREKFDESRFEDEEVEATVRLDWQLGPRVVASLHYDRLDRDSSDPTYSATENRVGIRFAFRAASGRR